jgi:hypothetical protein
MMRPGMHTEEDLDGMVVDDPEALALFMGDGNPDMFGLGFEMDEEMDEEMDDAEGAAAIPEEHLILSQYVGAPAAVAAADVAADVAADAANVQQLASNNAEAAAAVLQCSNEFDAAFEVALVAIMTARDLHPKRTGSILKPEETVEHMTLMAAIETNVN